MRYDDKEGKKILSRIPFIFDPGKKILKNIVKKFKKLKYLFPALILARPGWDRMKKWKKKIYSQIPFKLDPGKKIPKKIRKKLKKLKYISPALFLAKTGCDRLKKKKKKVSP